MVLTTLERPAPISKRRIGFHLALVINLLVTLGVGIGASPFIGGAFGSNSLQGIDFGSTPIWRPFVPFAETNTPRTNQPTPEGTSGCWVTLVGQASGGDSAAGGSGGGGGAYITRTWIPASLLGPTYSVSVTTTSLSTYGNGAPSSFASGSRTLVAGGASTRNGGTVTASGVTPAAGSGSGGAGGQSAATGLNGVGGGGGGAGAGTSGFGDVSGGAGGKGNNGSSPGSSGASGTNNAADAPDQTGVPAGGGGGAGTKNNFGFQQSGNAGGGGYPGGGGGGRGSGTGGTTGSPGNGGGGYAKVEWE